MKDYKRKYFHIFVYGTLKRGYPNNYLLSDSKYLGEAITSNRYAMYGNGIPFVASDKGVSQITGEIYVVNERTLKLLDQLEGFRENSNIDSWYKRELIQVEQGNKLFHCFIYFNNNHEGKLIPSGNYDDYVRDKKFV
jgi:gamma-glutamylaminecyclotransferase